MNVIQSDLVREILLRVPYKWHDTLKAVCRKWECIVSNPKFYADRKICGASQHLLCLIQRDHMAEMAEMADDDYEDDEDDYHGEDEHFAIRIYDPVNRTSQRLPPIEDPDIHGIPRLCSCVVVNQKLVVMGGCYRSKTDLTKRVYIYDFASARWTRGADMPIPQSLFACSVCPSTGLVYVVGGLSEDYEYVTTAETYNVEEDKWEMLPPMIEHLGQRCEGVFVHGKFMMFTEHGFERSAEVFDPSARTWTRWENMLRFRGQSRCVTPCCSSSGELYVFSEPQVMKYDGNNNIWNVVASLPHPIRVVTCVTQWRDWIFVSGSDFRVRPYKHASYLFNPSTVQWIEVGGGDEGFEDMVDSVASIEV